MLTFREFYEICEGKKPDTPPHAVAGTVNRDSSGTLTYTLQSYDGPKGKPSKKEIEKKVLNQSGGKKVEKHAKKVAKTINKIKEDIEQRRQELRQKQLKQMATHKQNVANYHTSQRDRQIAAQEREQLKKEIKRELQSEQTPTMQPSDYNKQIAKQSLRWKGMQIRQAHGEMEHEAGAELSAKKARLKAIMSR
jgi:hypothetical protein